MLHPNSQYPHPGKFEGQRYLLVAAYAYVNAGQFEDSVGDVSEWPFVHIAKVDLGDKYGEVYVRTDDQGFVQETDAREFSNLGMELVRQDEIKEALDNANEKLEALTSEEFPCAQCVSLAINGLNTHEAGCPVQSRKRTLLRTIENLENE